jgi:hypothetical protein
MPIALCANIFDLFLLQGATDWAHARLTTSIVTGYLIIHRVALALLKILETKLLNSDLVRDERLRCTA